MFFPAFPLLFWLLPWFVITRGAECSILYAWEPEVLVMVQVRDRKGRSPVAASLKCHLRHFIFHYQNYPGFLGAICHA